jgi:hypothetical protein
MLGPGRPPRTDRARNAAGEIRKTDALLYDETDPRMPEIQRLLDAANDAVDDALAKGARVHLLFGDQSPTGVAVTGVGAQLRNVCAALEHQPDSIRGSTAMSQYSKNFTGTLDYHQRFNRAALAALQQTWWDRLLERLRIKKKP